MYWFQTIENRLTEAPSLARDILRAADASWSRISDSDIFLFDRGNTGEWIRPWLNALRVLRA